MMTCKEARERWEVGRDGALPAATRAMFEQHLAGCPACGQQWQAESAWLAALAEDDAELHDPLASAGFRATVVARWDAQPRPGVLARIGRRWIAPAAALLAAAAALVLALTWPATPPPPVVTPPRGLPPGALAQLVQELDEHYAQPPVRVLTSIQRLSPRREWNRLLDLIDVPVPDPAQYLAPGRG